MQLNVQNKPCIVDRCSTARADACGRNQYIFAYRADVPLETKPPWKLARTAEMWVPQHGPASLTCSKVPSLSDVTAADGTLLQEEQHFLLPCCTNSLEDDVHCRVCAETVETSTSSSPRAILFGTSHVWIDYCRCVHSVRRRASQ